MFLHFFYLQFHLFSIILIHVHTCFLHFPKLSTIFPEFFHVFPSSPASRAPPRPWPLWRGQDFEKLAIFGDIRGRRGAELKVLSAIETKSPGGTLFQMSEICSFGYGSIPMKIP
jgi:hypothetical protein